MNVLNEKLLFYAPNRFEMFESIEWKCNKLLTFLGAIISFAPESIKPATPLDALTAFYPALCFVFVIYV
jgi:hypothetical protein